MDNERIIDSMKNAISANYNLTAEINALQRSYFKEYTTLVFEVLKVDKIIFQLPIYTSTIHFGLPQEVKVIGINRDLMVICQQMNKVGVCLLPMNTFNLFSFYNIHCAIDKYYTEASTELAIR